MLTRTTSQRFLHDTQARHGFTLCNHHKASGLEVGWEVASPIIRIERKGKEVKVQVSKFDLWLDGILTYVIKLIFYLRSVS